MPKRGDRVLLLFRPEATGAQVLYQLQGEKGEPVGQHVLTVGALFVAAGRRELVVDIPVGDRVIRGCRVRRADLLTWGLDERQS